MWTPAGSGSKLLTGASPAVPEAAAVEHAPAREPGPHFNEIGTLPPSVTPPAESPAHPVQRQTHIHIRPRQPEWLGGRLTAEERPGSLHRHAPVSQASITIQRLPITVGKKKIDTPHTIQPWKTVPELSLPPTTGAGPEKDDSPRVQVSLIAVR